MPFRPSLRARIVAALLIVVTLISGGYFYAVYELVELIEDDLMEGTVKRELSEFARRYATAPDTAPPTSAAFRTYIVRNGKPPPPDFPSWLQSWPAGRYDSFQLGQEEFYVGREDSADAQLYLVLDIENIERLEAQLAQLALLILIGAWVAAVAAGVLLSRRVMRPVSMLAERINTLEPADAKRKLRDEFQDREIHVIAAAFDSYRERLEEFVERERAFTDEASHELRTPLSVVLSAAQLLQEEPTLGERGRERVARIGRAARQMQDLVEALLFLAREDGGWNAEPCALDEVVEGIADAYRGALAERALSLHCEISAPRTVLAPPGMAHCVVSNLVGNAIRHTDKGRIDLRLEADRIVIQDTGSGIPPGELGRIFDRRYRDPQSRGLGLGLYLVKRICDRLGWRIEVQSAPGTGTRFDVTFVPAS
jgi:signal transduction histidine kinase